MVIETVVLRISIGPPFMTGTTRVARFARIEEAVLIARLVFLEAHFSNTDARTHLEALDDAGEVDGFARRRDGARTRAAAREVYAAASGSRVMASARRRRERAGVARCSV